MKCSVLDRDQIDSLRQKTAQIIAETGFKVYSEEILNRAEKAGALVDYDQKVIRLSQDLLNSLLMTVPKIFTVKGATGDSYLIGGEKQYATGIVTDPWIIDLESKKPRRPCLDDLLKNTILVQKLPQVACVSRMDFPVTDDEGPASSQRALLLHLLNHTKHNIAYISIDEDLELWLEIGRILNGGKSLNGSGILSFAVAVRSPLTISDLNCSILLAATKHGLPVFPTVCPIAGATAPYDMAGALLLANAEVVFLAALTQILRPQNPFVHMAGLSTFNMKTGANQYYTQEKMLWKIAAIELAHSYGLPCGAECGGTMDWRQEIQSGAESMAFMLAAVQSEASLITGLGSCYNANGLSSATIVIQNAFLEAARYVKSGIALDNLAEAYEDIRTAGQTGHFLVDDLTLRQLHSNAFFNSPLFNYSGEFKEDQTDKSMWQRAVDEVCRMTANYQSPVPQDIQSNLKTLFRNRFSI